MAEVAERGRGRRISLVTMVVGAVVFWGMFKRNEDGKEQTESRKCGEKKNEMAIGEGTAGHEFDENEHRAGFFHKACKRFG